MNSITLLPQYKVLKNENRYTIVTGGRGSAKSFHVSVFLLLLTYQKDEIILFTRYTMTSARKSIIPEFREKIDLMGVEDAFIVKDTEIENRYTGSKILFSGIKTSSGNQTANLKSITGLTCWVLDEAEEMVNEDEFDRIDQSIRKAGKHNRVIIVMNPCEKQHFIYKRFFQSGNAEDTTYIHTTYKDNIDYLSESFINQIELLEKTNKRKYEHTILGGWLDKAEGVIYSNWTIGEFQTPSTSVFGQDFGFSVDPTTLVETSIDSKNKCIYLKLHYYKPNLTTTQIAELNNRIAKDSLIVADSAEPRLIAELSNKGNNVVPTIKGAGSVIFGISLLQDYDLIIHPDSLELIKELNNYCWLEKKSNTPIDNHNHVIDAIRYAVSYQLDNPNRGNYAIH